MTETTQTGNVSDEALDALLAGLTDPGEGRGFRARVMARLGGGAPQVPPATVPWRGLAASLGVAAVVFGAFLAWRASDPSPRHDASTAPDAGPVASSPPAVDLPGASVAGRDVATGATATTRPDSGPARVPRAGDATVPSQVTTAANFAEDEPLPYGMERIRVATVSIPPVTVSELGEDPSLAALARPDPVLIDPIDIDPIAPR
jgi:hypothetical protein